MNNPVMKQIYISLLNCKNKIIQTEPTSALYLPLFGESRITKDNSPAYCKWAVGSRVIDIITSEGEFITNDVHIITRYYDIKITKLYCGKSQGNLWKRIGKKLNSTALSK